MRCTLKIHILCHRKIYLFKEKSKHLNSYVEYILSVQHLLTALAGVLQQEHFSKFSKGLKTLNVYLQHFWIVNVMNSS